MAKRTRPAPEATSEDLELFASFVRGQQRAERDAKAAERAARRAASEHERLGRAKDDAAAEVKRLRGSERATAEQRAAADDAYKAALAALVAAETGTTPAWAPPDADEPAAEPKSAGAAETTAEPEEVAADEPEGAPSEGADDQ